MVVYSQTHQGWLFSLSNGTIRQTLFQVIAASGLMALFSQIKLSLPFTPVPFTLQTLAVLLIGATLGSRKGTWALLLYFAEILMGLPVLAGGVVNPLVFFGPTGGYVLGWALQAFCMGWFVERTTYTRSITLLLGGFVSCTLQMGFGVLGLASFVGWDHVWTMGLYPFIPGEALKVLLVCFCLTSRQSSQTSTL